MPESLAVNQKFVKFHFFAGFVSPKPEVVAVEKFDIMTLDIPADAMCFTYFEAQSLEQAQKADLKNNVSFFFGGPNDVVPLEQFLQENEMQATLIDYLRDEGRWNEDHKRVLYLDPYKMNQTYLCDWDVVIDPETRAVTVVPPENRLGL